MKTLAGAIIIFASAVLYHGVLLFLGLAAGNGATSMRVANEADLARILVSALFVVGLILTVWGTIESWRQTE